MAENMSFEDFKEQCGGLICRNLNAAVVSAEQLPGHFSTLNFPLQDMAAGDKLLVHVFDVILDHGDPVDFDELIRTYKRAHDLGDISVLPPPFGLKNIGSAEVQIQFVVITHDDNSYTIFKHLIFPHKINAGVFKQMVFGIPKKAMFMSQEAKMGRKIIQYCLENMGGPLVQDCRTH